ncbi:YfjI family protein [Runella sp.]|uniref:YfjI family protein n=1 Tax=Runella sp. TaxID=1960881 RepID=UPI00301A63C2
MTKIQNITDFAYSLNAHVQALESQVFDVEIPNGFDLNDTGQEHPDPQPIEKPLPDVEVLDPDLLPDGLKGWTVDIAHRKQVPLDFPAATAITLISGLIGSRIGIKPKKYDDWLVIPNLWGMIVASPGMMKSPVINDVSKPTKKLEQEADHTYQVECKKFAVANELRKIQIEGIKGKIKKGSKPELLSELENAMSDEETKPIQKRYLANDATIEKLGMIHNDNPAGLTILRDELAGWLASLERAGHEQDRAFFLEAWNGNGSFQVDRVMRASLSVKNLCLAVFGGIQPSKLAGYFQSLNTFGNDGMIQRFQLAVYPDRLANWQYVDRYPEKESREKAYRIFEQLAHFDPQTLAVVDEYDEQPYMRFTADAQLIFKSWLESLEGKLRSDQFTALLEEHFGKYRSLVPSLALIFHLIDYASLTADESAKIEICKQGVSADALQKAIKFAEYLATHAKRIYSMMSDSGQQAAYQLSTKIADGKLSDGFTVRDIQQKAWHLLTDNTAISEAVKKLVSADWLIENVPQPTGGRPAASRYDINPRTQNFYKNA